MKTKAEKLEGLLDEFMDWCAHSYNPTKNSRPNIFMPEKLVLSKILCLFGYKKRKPKQEFYCAVRYKQHYCCKLRGHKKNHTCKCKKTFPKRKRK